MSIFNRLFGKQNKSSEESKKTQNSLNLESIQDKVKDLASIIFGMDPSEIDINTALRTYLADPIVLDNSLFQLDLIQVFQDIELNFKIKIEDEDFYSSSIPNWENCTVFSLAEIVFQKVSQINQGVPFLHNLTIEKQSSKSTSSRSEFNPERYANSIVARHLNKEAETLVNNRQYEQALKKALESREFARNNLGEFNQEYDVSLQMLAKIYYNLGEYHKAELLCLESLRINEKVLGKNHPEYAKGCNNLAELYNITGNYEKAEPLYCEAKQIREKVLGKEHPDYAAICNKLAVLYVNLSQYYKAEPYYLEAKQIREKVFGKEHASYAESCDNLANLYHRTNQFEKAELLYFEAKQIREKVLGKEHPDYYESCNNLASLYRDAGLYQKAEPLLFEVKQIQLNILGKLHPDYAATCNKLGLIYIATAQYKKAELILLESKEIREKLYGKDHPDYGNSCNSLAGLYKDLEQYQKAVPLFLEAKRVIEKTVGKQHYFYAATCNNLAGVFRHIGQYQKAELLYLEAKQVCEKVIGREHPDYLTTCDQLGSLYSEVGQYQKAELLYSEAKQKREEVLGKEHPDYANSCSNLADLYYFTHQNQKAEALYLEAKRITEKVEGKDHPVYAIRCGNLANFYDDLGQYQKAELLFLEAKRVIENVQGKENSRYTTTCNNLAVLYENMHQYQKAELFYLEAMEISEKLFGKETSEYAMTCDNLARSYNSSGQYEKAERLFFEANQIIEKLLGKDHLDYGYHCNNLALFYLSTCQYQKAEPFLLIARQIIEKALGKEHTDAVCFNLGCVYWNMNLYSVAQIAFEDAIKQVCKKVNKVFEFTSENEKYSYLAKVNNLNQQFISFVISRRFNNSGLVYNWIIFYRNLILFSSRHLHEVMYTISDPTIGNKYNEWMGIRSQLAILYTNPIPEKVEVTKNLEEKASILEKELTRVSSNFAQKQAFKEITWNKIQERLEQEEASIEFLEVQYFDGKQWTNITIYVAVLLKKDHLKPEVIHLFGKKQLDDVLIKGSERDEQGHILSIYGIDKDTENIPISNTLYNLIWQPLEKYLQGIQKIYFAPAGLLHRVSFSALPINKGEVLSDKYQLIQLDTTASLVNQFPDFIKANDKIILYGGVQYDFDSVYLKEIIRLSRTRSTATKSLPDDLIRSGRFNYLNGTKMEVDSIKKLSMEKQLAVTVLSGVAANEESIKALTGKESPSILHIATHGFSFPQPKQEKQDPFQQKLGRPGGDIFRQSDDPLFRSGLIMAGANHSWNGSPISGIEDGILTAYEVSNLYLPNTKLVVLSACETGLGDVQGSEGVYGLQRAFKMAGVKNLLMSLWKVPDQETSEFMHQFYKNIFNNQSIDNAFYSTQTFMKSKYRKEPYKWAAWVLVR